MTDDPITVDARQDGDDVELATEPTNDDPSLEEQVEQSVTRRLKAADGDDTLEKAINARAEVEQAYQQHVQNLTQQKQSLQQSEQQVQNLEVSIERIEAQPDDQPLYQQLAGGVSARVPPDDPSSDAEYTRGDLLDDLAESQEAHERMIEELEGRVENMESEIERLQLVHRELSKMQSRLDAE